ncbi:MAG: Ig-like domain-containing protein, partial [Candidatus Marinimicrobia bacterium]|nr:Ig-like domain-containing protein [Candidatus Neomarinimicrobiota bacterium]
DPRFVDTANGDYHLADWSPCIGTGLDTSIVSSTDIEGNPRPNPAGSNPDMGAYENSLGIPIEHIVITSDTLLVTEDSSATVDFRENDLVLNAIALVLSILDSSSHGAIAVAGDTMLAYTPVADFFGYDTVQYALSGTTVADTGFVFITVVNEDDMPVVVNAIPDITVNEDAPDSLLADLDVVFMDIDDELEYSHVIVDTTLVFASVTNDSVTLQFLPDANGSTDIIFTATNPTIRASVSDTMTVTILPINDVPLMSALADTTIDEDGAIDIVLSASDIDEDALTFTATADTSAVIASVSTDTLSVSLVDNWNGSSILMVVVSDGSATDTTSFELTVNTVNDAPSSFALSEQDSVYITMANFDSDSIVFAWDESADVEDDELSYHFTAELVINNQLTTEYDTTLTANAMKIDYKSVFDEIYAA